jgi:bacterioferritin
MTKDVGLEQGAVDQYRAHIEEIDDPGIQRLLSRILADELVHHGQFSEYAEEFADDAEMAAKIANVNAEATGPGERTGEILNQGIRHEYTVVLQYLYHSFMAKGKEEFEELQNTAINEMQHLGWLAEAMASRGGHPDMSHGPLFLSSDMEANLEADIAVEQEVTRDYTAQMPELDDPDLQSLVERIRDHEIYHDTTFKELLAEVREEAAAAAEAGEAAQSETPATGEAPDRESPAPPALGSLLGRTQD